MGKKSLPPNMSSSLSEAFRSFTAAIVTGGSSGLGQAFIRNGLKVHPELRFCNLSRSTPENFSDGKYLHHIPCDLGRSDDVEHAARQVESWLTGTPRGRVLLINNSGFGAYAPFPEPNLSRQLEMIDVNTRAVVHLTGLLLPTLQARGGAIITIASVMGFQPTPYGATYGATKAFVLHWTLALNEELKGSAVRAVAVSPGSTKSNFFRAAGMPAQPVSPTVSMEPDDVVADAMRALAKGRAQVVPGWRNKMMTFLASRVSKPFAARVAGNFIAKTRVTKAGR